MRIISTSNFSTQDLPKGITMSHTGSLVEPSDTYFNTPLVGTEAETLGAWS